jgi:hypothetical protein
MKISFYSLIAQYTLNTPEPKIIAVLFTVPQMPMEMSSQARTWLTFNERSVTEWSLATPQTQWPTRVDTPTGGTYSRSTYTQIYQR